MTYNGTWDKEGRQRRNHANENHKCANCGAPFKHPYQYYCSEKCAEEFYLEHHGGIWSDLRVKVLKRDKRKCVLCGNEGNEVDHIVELDRGGNNKLSNLRNLCHECHSKKTASYVRKKWHKQAVMITINPDDYLLEPSQSLITQFVSHSG